MQVETKRKQVAILITDKLVFKTKMVTRDREYTYIMIKGSIHQEDSTIINICTPSLRAPKYIKQILT